MRSGCSIILKAAEETPAGAMHIAKAFEDVGLPAGVLNLVFGVPADISQYLIPDDRIRLVAFTGSTGVGRHLTGLASQHMTPVLMELAVSAPVIVCEDTDVDAAAVSSAIRAMRNAGQVCTSPTRFFVTNRSMTVSSTASPPAAATVVGDGLTDGVEMGPLANGRRLSAMRLVDDAVAAGGTLRPVGLASASRATSSSRPCLPMCPTTLGSCKEPFGTGRDRQPGPRSRHRDRPGQLGAVRPRRLRLHNRADHVDEMVERVEAGNLSINTPKRRCPRRRSGA